MRLNGASLANEDSLGSISRLIVSARNGESWAESELWDRCSPMLLIAARRLLNPGDRVVADEEDIVVSCFFSLFQRLSSGQCEALVHRSQLWSLLFTAVQHKTIGQIRYLRRQRRTPPESPSLPISAPDASFLVEQADTLEHLLTVLPSDEARRISVMKLDGFTNREIAAELGMSLATVERRLATIREYWKWEARDEV